MAQSLFQKIKLHDKPPVLAGGLANNNSMRSQERTRRSSHGEARALEGNLAKKFCCTIHRECNISARQQGI